jgi:hypothetical protein
MPRNVEIDGSKISDWESFHGCFSAALGFPGFYGRNMDAWNDCMTSLDKPEEGLSSIHVGSGDVLVLCIMEASSLKKRCPEIFDALVECAAFVNYRRIDEGDAAIVALSFHV